jgi:hypothetical protein
VPKSRRPVVAPGVQPQAGGRLQCLECGRWYRALGQHVRVKHGLTARQYKAEYQLPTSRGLVADDLREAFAVRQRRRIAQEPGVAEALREGTALLSGRSVKARRHAARQASEQRAAWRAAANQASLVRSRQIKADNDALARRHGHTDIETLLRHSVHLTAAVLGQQVGRSEHQIRKLRARYAIASQSRRHNGKGAAVS